MSRAWSRQRERGAPFLVRFIIWIALHLGRRTARALLYPITGYFLLFAPAQRRASRAFLTRALGRPSTWRDTARHIHTFAAVILDRVFLLADRADDIELEVHGAELIQEQHAAGVGCLLLGAHLGSFEVLRVMTLRGGGLPLKVLMFPNHNQVITRLLHALNPAIEQMVIPLGTPDSLLRVSESLGQGEMVSILGDRVTGHDKAVPCTFFGAAVDFPVGPATLSAILKAPVFLCLGLYRGNGRYEIHFERLGDPPPRRDPAALHEWTQRYAARLEHYARSAPFNWFNFYDYWTTDDAAPSR